MKIAACAVVLVCLAACGGAGPVVVPGGEAPKVPDTIVPEQLLDLRTAPEDVSERFMEAADRAFVTDLRLWSLREGKRLRATIEVGRFAADARPGDPTFQRAMASQLGSSQARLRRIEDRSVYVAPGNSQTLFLWFDGPHFVLLGVSTEYPTPRALARAAIEGVAA